MKKIVVLVVLLAAIGGGGFFVYQNLGGWARTQAQIIASDAAGVDVTIGNIDVSWADKTLLLTNIKVANPNGFDTSHSIMLDNVRAKAEHISREKIVLREVVVSGEDINLETQLNKVNLRELLKGVQSRMAAKGGKPSSLDIKAPKLVIKEFRIEQGKLNSTMALLGKKTGAKLTIPVIRMYNLGEGKSSSNASAVAAKIIQEILTKSIQAASQQGLIQGNIKDVGKGLVDSVKGMKDGLFH